MRYQIDRPDFCRKAENFSKEAILKLIERRGIVSTHLLGDRMTYLRTIRNRMISR